MSRLHLPSLFQLVVSVVLLLSGLFEMFDTVIEKFLGVEIEAMHGVVVFALAKMAKEAMELWSKVTETRERIGEVKREIGEVRREFGGSKAPAEAAPVREGASA